MAARGQSPSAETRTKIGDALRGRSLSAETRARLSAAMRGRKTTEETKKKISDGLRARLYARGGRLRHGHGRGGRGSATYAAWFQMVASCTYPGMWSWRRCGALGVRVCARWHQPRGSGRANVGFDNFLADMGERPGRLVVGRIDSAGDFELSNCRWVASSRSR